MHKLYFPLPSLIIVLFFELVSFLVVFSFSHSHLNATIRPSHFFSIFYLSLFFLHPSASVHLKLYHMCVCVCVHVCEIYMYTQTYMCHWHGDHLHGAKRPFWLPLVILCASKMGATGMAPRTTMKPLLYVKIYFVKDTFINCTK